MVMMVKTPVQIMNQGMAAVLLLCLWPLSDCWGWACQACGDSPSARTAYAGVVPLAETKLCCRFRAFCESICAVPDRVGPVTI